MDCIGRLVILGQSKTWTGYAGGLTGYTGTEYEWTGYAGTLVKTGMKRMNVLVIPEQRLST